MELSYNLILEEEFETGITKVTDALKTEGLGKDLHPIAILGACNPKLAYEAYLKDSNMLLLVPCNVVIEQTEAKKLSVKMIKPSAMMKSLSSSAFQKLAEEADLTLLKVVRLLKLN
mgnify:CR=1 FL=1